MKDILFEEEVGIEVVSDEDREKLQEFARGLAGLNALVQAMRGPRRGIIHRAYAKEVQRLAAEEKALTSR